MEKIIKWFSAAFGAMFGLAAGAIVAAAPGDLVYATPAVQVRMSLPQAACFADCAIAVDGLWDGNRADMRALCINRDSQGFEAWVTGIKTDTAANLAARGADGENIQVVGIVE